jgi:hypothetical protein
VTIVLLVEGETEMALKAVLKRFLDQRATEHGQPHVRLRTRKIKNMNRDSLGRQIRLESQARENTAVVGLLDVFPRFEHANAAKSFLVEAARRAGVTRGFYAHAAQYDVEAWLLPYWDDICRRIGIRQGQPASNPEEVNGINPPAHRLRELYRRAKRDYTKTTEMPILLADKDLTIAANACPEFKSLLNTLLDLSNLPHLA